jgi:membrane protein YqaA with SNARE-associated domain
MNCMRRLYDWVLGWAHHPHSQIALFGISFVESSVLPAPPDPLLMALTFGRPSAWWRFALNCTVASVLGGLVGYLLGVVAQDLITQIMLFAVDGLSGAGTFLGTPAGGIAPQVFGSHQLYLDGLLWHVTALYQENAFLALLGAALTPIPFKVFTIGAGYCDVGLGVFIAASVIGRGGRFFAVSAIVAKFGPTIRPIMDRYFNLFMVLFFLLLIGGFAMVRWL